MTDFKIVTAFSLKELEKFVDNWVKEGWIPSGSITIVPADGLRATQYVHAMTFTKPPEYTGPR
jgi:hypothetical protein